MKHKRSKLSFYTCVALCGVSLIAQTDALRAMEVPTEEVIKSSVLEVEVVKPIEDSSEVTNLIEFKDLVKTFDTQEDFEQLKLDINSVPELAIRSPISKTDRADELGMAMVRILQKVESILRVDLGDLIESHKSNAPHASNYYKLLPANLAADNPNKEYYQWLVQAVYTVQQALSNKLVTPTNLQAGYQSYLENDTPYSWLYNEVASATESSFAAILGLLAKVETQNNPYLVETSLYYLSKKRECVDLPEDHLVMASGANSPRGLLEFVVYDNLGDGTCGWHGIGVPYEKALQTLQHAVFDQRMFQSEFFSLLTRRSMAVEGESKIIDDRIRFVYDAALKSAREETPVLSLAQCVAKAQEGVSKTIQPVSDALESIKTELKQKLDEQQKLVPYLTDIGDEPEAEDERLLWNASREEWMQNHQAEFNDWNNAKIAIDDIYEKKQYLTLYSGLLRRTTVVFQDVANFIAQDFTRVFPSRFLELDPEGKNQSMHYFDMLIRLEHFNVYLWMETANNTIFKKV